jgi:TolA-binding protein
MFTALIANQATIIGNQHAIRDAQKEIASLVRQSLMNQATIVANQEAIQRRVDEIARNTYGAIHGAALDAAMSAPASTWLPPSSDK